MKRVIDDFMGMRVVASPDQPRYTLPDDVPPPPGMTRAEFAAWSRVVCGVVNILPPGHIYILPEQIVRLSSL